MSQTAESLSKQALLLAPVERLALVEHILDSLDLPDASVDSLWAREAENRLAAYRRGDIAAIPLAEVIAKYQVADRG